jgi:hypothetical protein
MKLSESLNSNKIIALSGVFFIILALGLAMGFVPYKLDDAYISYRYAENLSQGFGFSYNQGGPQVEGFSSPLWVGLLTVFSLIFSAQSLPFFSSLIGAVSFALIILATLPAWRNNQYLHNSDIFFSMIPVALMALNPGFQFYSLTGMEQLFFVMLMVVYCQALSGNIKFHWGIIAGILAAFTRPEAPWFLVTGFIFWFFLYPAIEKKKWIYLGFFMGISILIVFAARLIIFDSLLPNTYYAKTPFIKNGFVYVLEYLGQAWFALIFFLGLMGAYFGKPTHRACFFSAVSWLAVAIYVGGDWMPAARFLLPSLALFAMSSMGIAFLQTRLTKRKLANATKTIMTLLVIVTLFLQVQKIIFYQQGISRALKGVNQRDKFLSDWVMLSSAKSIATVDIGYLGFSTKKEIIDLAGLTNTQIGRAPGHHLEKEFDPNYVFFEKQPDIIIIRVDSTPVFDHHELISFKVNCPIDGLLVRHPSFKTNYYFLFSLLPDFRKSKNYGNMIFIRRDFIVPKKAIPKKTEFVIDF